VWLLQRSGDMKKKAKRQEAFGERLARIRKSRGLTQAELGEAVGVSQRVIAYYETEGEQPPGALLVDLARVLAVSSDELLGLQDVAALTTPKTARLIKRLQRIEELPVSDQKALLKFLDALLDSKKAS